MDGDAIMDALASCSGPDCLKEVLPKYGQRIKLYKAISQEVGLELHFYSIENKYDIIRSITVRIHFLIMVQQDLQLKRYR